MQNILLIALGGVIGTLMRYGISSHSLFASSGVFPWGTLVVNLLGCFVIGLLWAALPSSISPSIRNMLLIGILGSFTTFSSFALEGIRLFESGHTGSAVAYILVSNLAGLLLAFGGVVLGKQLT